MDNLLLLPPLNYIGAEALASPDEAKASAPNVKIIMTTYLALFIQHARHSRYVPTEFLRIIE